MSSKKKFLAFTVFLMGLALSYQNCGGFTPLGFGDDVGSNGGGGNVGGSGDEIPDKKLIPQAKPLLMNRQILVSKLATIFDSDNDGSEVNLLTLQGILSPNIETRISAFGGPCMIMGPGGPPSCRGNLANATEKVRPDSQSIREGFRLKTCEKLVESVVFLRNAIKLTSGDIATTPSSKNIREVYEMFYSTQTITKEVRSALNDVVERAEKIGGPNDAWRFLILTVCVTPAWQIL